MTKRMERNLASAAVALLACTAAVRAASSIRIDNDGIRYALVADQMLKGRGERSPIVYYPQLFTSPPDAHGTVPFTNNPPMLSAVFAALGGVRPGRLWPAQAVNVCAHIATALLCLLVARRMAGTAAGVGAGCLAAVAFPLLSPVTQIWSEPLFIAFLLATIAFLQGARGRPDAGGMLAASGLAAAAAFMTRWVGVALVPLLLWESLRALRRAGARRGLRDAVRILAIPLAVFALFSVRNYLVKGGVRGLWEEPGPPQSWIANLLGFGGHLGELLGLAVPSERAAAAFVVALIPAACLTTTRRGRAALARLVSRGLDLVIVAGASYIAVLAYSLATVLMYYDPRFAAPLYPLIAIAGCSLIAAGWGSLDGRRLRRWAAAGAVASLALVVAAEARRSLEKLPRRGTSGDYGMGIEAYRYAVSRCGPGEMIVTNAPYMVTFFSGIPTVCLPYRHPGLEWQRVPSDLPATLPRKMREIGARFLLLLRIVDGLPREEWGNVRQGLPENTWGSYIEGLSRPTPHPEKGGIFSHRREESGELIKVYECPDGVVYRCASSPTPRARSGRLNGSHAPSRTSL